MKTIFHDKVFTVPNLLSFFRICLIPAIIWLYISRDESLYAALLLLLSGLTDTLDGFIARRFDLVSELGKALDPVADKLTQIAVVFCLVYRFPHFLLLLLVLCLKELFVGLTSLFAMRRLGHVLAANWHGKIATTLMYAVMALHLLWPDIPASISDTAVGICIGMLLLSGILYGIRNFAALREENAKTQQSLDSPTKGESA